MGFIKNLMGHFKKQKHIEIENLSYNGELIAMLQHDHQQLFEIFRDIQAQYKNDNTFASMESLINDFKLALEIHLMMEDTQLYGYLRQITPDESEDHAFVNEMQEEMSEYVKKIIKFIDKYSDEKSYTKNVAKFLDELGSVGMILTQRFNTEEERLYPLYKEA
ncbi:MAG: hemerythrin domain-containing protein [Campylobacterales bacterium]|nr:hemerythrin domain-containing protein [Campylobacterales bacterium]